MSLPTARAAYKKRDGILKLSPDQKSVQWCPLPGDSPVVTLAVANITNLQQTPDNSPKVMLKIFGKNPAGGDPTSYLFHFNSSEARSEANAIKEVLSKLITNARSHDPSVPKPVRAATASTTNGISTNGAADTPGSASGSMAFAAAANATTAGSAAARWFDDNQLKNDIELQQSLMKRDRNLHQTYMEARRTKPETISNAAFNAQFWSTRTNLLRAHAIEINQKKGSYNVLLSVKPRTVDGELKLKLSVEQVQMILNQHPLVRQIYNESVPKIPEHEFWSRFFLSRLSKKLRGERVTDADNMDTLFDQYDETRNMYDFESKVLSQPVPRIIDLAANEENQGGFRSGNRKDQEMRPRQNVPIIRTLNSISEKIMANVAPSDADPHAPKGIDEETYKQMMLRDLQDDADENRILLNIQAQNLFFGKGSSSSGNTSSSSNAQVFAQQNPSEILRYFHDDLQSITSRDNINLHEAIGVRDDSDSDTDTEAPNTHHIGSRAARKAADAHIASSIRQRRIEKYGSRTLTDPANPMSLASSIPDRCALTHATTTEFLHQFWTAFLSGDPDRAPELQYLDESLARSIERIDAVACDADAARKALIQERKDAVVQLFHRTGVRTKPKIDGIGGAEAVRQMMQPTLEALVRARRAYAEALAAEGMQVSVE